MAGRVSQGMLPPSFVLVGAVELDLDEGDEVRPNDKFHVGSLWVIGLLAGESSGFFNWLDAATASAAPAVRGTPHSSAQTGLRGRRPKTARQERGE